MFQCNPSRTIYLHSKLAVTLLVPFFKFNFLNICYQLILLVKLQIFIQYSFNKVYIRYGMVRYGMYKWGNKYKHSCAHPV